MRLSSRNNILVVPPGGVPVNVRIEEGIKKPRHVAVIMDGNGRWAQRRDSPRLEGHRKGAETIREITTAALESGLNYLTLYSFSIQNWQRPLSEVSSLFNLMEEYCAGERELLMKNDIRFKIIGSIARLPESTAMALKSLCQATRDNRSMVLTLAIDYGAREELIEAARAMGEAVARGELSPDAIDETVFVSHLGSADLPDPDLLIRTSGELRLSNFLLWQSAYTELIFTNVLWPDFGRKEFEACLKDFSLRQRRFGATAEQVASGEKIQRQRD